LNQRAQGLPRLVAHGVVAAVGVVVGAGFGLGCTAGVPKIDEGEDEVAFESTVEWPGRLSGDRGLQ
jgi:hypothetical protein